MPQACALRRVRTVRHRLGGGRGAGGGRHAVPPRPRFRRPRLKPTARSSRRRRRDHGPGPVALPPGRAKPAGAAARLCRPARGRDRARRQSSGLRPVRRCRLGADLAGCRFRSAPEGVTLLRGVVFPAALRAIAWKPLVRHLFQDGGTDTLGTGRSSPKVGFLVVFFGSTPYSGPG